jgi:4-hydroxybenzoate polyprenyltransferase
MNQSRLLAYAHLLRIPNVFTAFADIAMAGCAAGYILDRPDVFGLLLLASGCLYLGGMVLNDFFDWKEDAKARPFRPIPSGRISVLTAGLLGQALLTGGLVFAGMAHVILDRPKTPPSPALIAIGLFLAISVYDSVLKRTPFGPLGMGFCRFLNVLLGLSGSVDQWPNDLSFHVLALHLAAIIGVYIVGVTWFARTEESASNRRQLIGAALVMLLALGLAITIPVHLPPGASPVYFPYLVAAFGFYVGSKVVEAIRLPGPKEVQAAVKRCILGLVALDAVLASAFVGAWGLLILLLLLPARWLGKWVYST